jgi:hypothetical protein
VLSVLLLLGLLMSLRADPPAGAETQTKPLQAQDSDARGRWMRAKTSSAQEIFASLVSRDLARVETTARRMQGLNLLEQWLQATDYVNKSDYQAQLNLFEFALKELIRTARADDVEGALQAFLRMSESCVHCHQLIRDRPVEQTSSAGDEK